MRVFIAPYAMGSLCAPKPLGYWDTNYILYCEFHNKKELCNSQNRT